MSRRMAEEKKNKVKSTEAINGLIFIAERRERSGRQSYPAICKTV